MIQFDNLTKIYDDGTVALEKINLEIGKGETIFITGTSGAGKTTLLKLLTREIRPDEGNIYIDDLVLNDLSRQELPLLRRQIGTVFQDLKLLPNLTVAENIAFAMSVVDFDRHEIENAVPEILELVGLKGQENKLPKYLSGGEKQKVAIARALSIEPQILLADEPTGNIDLESAHNIMDLFHTINRNLGTTLLITTHNPRLVDRAKKRVITLEQGRIVKDEDTKKEEHKEEHKKEDKKEEKEHSAEHKKEEKKEEHKEEHKKEEKE